MSQHDMELANSSGAGFRADLNNALPALASNSAGSLDPADLSNPDTGGTTFPYQYWVDTSGANPILKIRNGSNNGWVIIGRIDIANFGALLLAVATRQTLQGPLAFANTDYLKIPVGTTAQRPAAGSGDSAPAAGMLRYNTDLTQYEGHNGTAWAPIGGGGYAVTAVQSIAAGGSVNSSTTDTRQLRLVAGNGGPQLLSTTPFGVGGGWRDGTEMTLVGTSDANTVILTFNDSANGVVGDFDTIEIGRYKVVNLIWSAALSRWLLK